jgi:hypothetical protein
MDRRTRSPALVKDPGTLEIGNRNITQPPIKSPYLRCRYHKYRRPFPLPRPHNPNTYFPLHLIALRILTPSHTTPHRTILMESSLHTLNDTLSSALHDLRTIHRPSLAAAHAIPDEASGLPPRTPELERSVELLHELLQLLTPPLYKLIDGMFGTATFI